MGAPSPNDHTRAGRARRSHGEQAVLGYPRRVSAAVLGDWDMLVGRLYAD